MAKTVTRNGKATAPKATKATEAESAVTEAENEEAQAAAKAEEEARNSALGDLRGRLVDTLEDLKASDKRSAEEARMAWVKVGQMLREGRNMFMKGNNPNDVAFGRWIADQNIAALGQRPTRAAALWLADVYDTNQDLYALFPTESVNGEPLRRSPRTLRDWVRDQMNAAFQIAWEASTTSDEPVTAVGDLEADAKEGTAKTSLTNVFSALSEIIDSADDKVGRTSDALKAAKGTEARAKASEAFSTAAANLEYYQGLKDMLDVHSDEERLSYFMAWKPKVQNVPFKECDVDTAADRVFALLKTHPDFSAVYEALGGLVEAMAEKVREDAEEAERKAAADAGSADEDAPEFDADADADDADEDSFDADDSFDDDADDAFPEDAGDADDADEE